MQIYQHYSENGLFSSKIYHFTTIDSTNEEAKRRAETHQLQNFDIIISNEQSTGKGRNNKDWHSPLGNLYFSIYLNNEEVNKINNRAYIFNVIAILSMHLAISKLLTKDLLLALKIKWPNDLLFNNKKICGILSKISQNNSGEKSKEKFMIIGIGVNINNHPPDELLNNFKATNLQEIGVNTNNIALLELFLDRFFTTYQKWQNFGEDLIRQQWLQYAHNLNQEITLSLEQEIYRGIFTGIDQDFNLMLQLPNNQIKKIGFCEILAIES